MTNDLVDSAVLVPAYRDAEGELKLVLVLRSDWGIHGGQIAFPGGKRGEQDASMEETALREAHEEIGLESSDVEILDALPVVETASTGFRIYPFLGRVVPSVWTPHEIEVAEVLEARVSILAKPETHGEEMRKFPQWPDPLRIEFYRVGSYKLWGATYRIVEPLLPRLLAGEWSL